MKATLVLLPLLGVTYMLFFVNPGEDDLSQIVFIYFNSFLQSFQVGHMAAWGLRALLAWNTHACTSTKSSHTGLAQTWIPYIHTEIQVHVHAEPEPWPLLPTPQSPGEPPAPIWVPVTLTYTCC